MTGSSAPIQDVCLQKEATIGKGPLYEATTSWCLGELVNQEGEIT